MAEFIVRYRSATTPPQEFHLRDLEMIVGSGADAGIRLETREVSRRHLRIIPRGGRLYVTDLGSTNGTYLNGQKLPPHLEVEWQPGMVLSIAGMTFEQQVEGAGVPGVRGPSVTAGQPGMLRMTVSPQVVSPGQPITIQVTYSGQDEQMLTLQANGLRPGLRIDIQPRAGAISAYAPAQAQARVLTTQPFIRGGTAQVRFSAMTVSGIFDTAEVTVRLRPRYEILLLMLPLLVACAALAMIVPPLFQPETPTPIPVTTSAPATFTPLPLTDTPPTTLTATGTGTVAPTLTPTDAVSVCVNQCAARGWTTYQARRGDTLSRLSVAAGVSMREVQQVNCIADPNRIVVGQGICFPVYPTLPDLAIAVVRTGEQDVGSPYPRFTQFTITVTSVGNAAIAGPVRVISTSPNSTIGSADGAGWRCTVAKMNALDCTFDGSVPVGTALPGIVVAHNDGSVFSAQVSAVGDSNPANNTASDFACTGQRCVELDYWRGQCARNVTPEPDAFHTPAAPDACDRWRNLTGGGVSAD